MGWIFLIYILGLPGYMWTRRHRAGVGFMHNLKPETILYNIQWSIESALGALVWPIMLVLWLSRGKPSSKWKVVGEKNGAPLIRKISDPEKSEGEKSTHS